MHLRVLFFALIIFITPTVQSQGVKGRLTDSKNNPVPFAAIYEESTYSGTTSNADGYYELKLPSGKHPLVFKALGYTVEKRLANVSSGFLVLNVNLVEQAYELKDVIVTPGKEDPAYAIMRKVIGLAPYHQNQVQEYSADVYLRGSMHVIKMPGFIGKRIEINGKKGVLKTGDVYLEESMNQIDFKAPDKYNQKVKSYRSNFPGENNVSPMQIIRASFYQPKVGEAISPLASNAFNYYKYRYEGYSREGENTIFKIKVIPKRNSQQLMSGYIFVLDKLWCLHSVDVSQEMFFGKLDYKEIFSPVKENAWLPMSYVFFVNAAIMGIKVDYKYTSSVKYQKVELNSKKVISPVKIAEEKEPAKVPEKKIDIKKQKNQQEIERLMAKEDLSNRDMVKLSTLMAKEAPKDTTNSKSLEIKNDERVKVSIEKDAMKKDTSYWNTARPIPLTKVESGLSDSIRVPNTDTSARKDSASLALNAKKKENKYAKYLFGGAGFYMFDSLVNVKYNGLIGFNQFDFNTVDGFVYKQTLDVNIKVDSAHRLNVYPGVAYAFSRKAFMWWTKFNYNYAPLNGGSLTLNYSKSSTDYNQQGAMNNHINALASLFFRRNYKKFYGEHHINLTNKIDIANGLTLTSGIGYRDEQLLQNHSDFSFFYQNTREYSSNVPVDAPEDQLNNVNNSEAYLNAGLQYTPQYYYKIVGGKKRYEHSKYPTFFVNYKKAIPKVLGSTANFDYLEAGAHQTKNWGMMHSFTWDVTGGKYVNKKKIYLSDYKFFNNQPLPVIIGNDRKSFFLAGLYENYSNESFVEGHITFATPYLLLKYLPFLSNKIWLENLHLNYLYTPRLGHYWEAGYSISQIYAVGGIGVYTGFKGTNFESAGVRITLGF